MLPFAWARSATFLKIQPPSEYVSVCGDPHNFGQCTVDCGEWIWKPRFGTWEYALLGECSKVRDAIDLILVELGISEVLPRLKFKSQQIHNFDGYYVEKLRWAPFETQKLSVEDMEKIGSVVGICQYFGIVDLHSENFILGIFKDRVVCAPVDIESVCNQVRLPSDMFLVPKVHQGEAYSPDSYGLSCLLKRLDALQTAAFIYGFLRTIELIKTKHLFLDKAICATTPKNAFIRVLHRNTFEYSSSMNEGRNHSNFTVCELEQMSRSDIPYYFRTKLSDRVEYFVKPGARSSASPDIQGKFSGNNFFFSSSDRINSFSEKQVIASALQLAYVLFERLQAIGEAKYKTIGVSYVEGKIRLEYKERFFQIKDE
ncbi:hypothetical protein [Oligoflexus tunisiensis]|uniref:hypothetical protein n=1 Tax=Oligoflexus tunisiensis TaxID=708132 RepID=UPI00114CA834|nr:hypothetical protein [Oligoflexus tunisiensis]